MNYAFSDKSVFVTANAVRETILGSTKRFEAKTYFRRNNIPYVKIILKKAEHFYALADAFAGNPNFKFIPDNKKRSLEQIAAMEIVESYPPVLSDLIRDYSPPVKRCVNKQLPTAESVSLKQVFVAMNEAGHTKKNFQNFLTFIRRIQAADVVKALDGKPLEEYTKIGIYLAMKEGELTVEKYDRLFFWQKAKQYLRQNGLPEKELTRLERERFGNSYSILTSALTLSESARKKNVLFESKLDAIVEEYRKNKKS